MVSVWNQFGSIYKRSGKHTFCYECKTDIEVGDFIWATRYRDPNGYSKLRHFHFYCLIERAEIWAQDNPYIPKPRGISTGRKALFPNNPEFTKEWRTLNRQLNRNQKERLRIIKMGLQYTDAYKERIEEINRLDEKIWARQQEMKEIQRSLKHQERITTNETNEDAIGESSTSITEYNSSSE